MDLRESKVAEDSSVRHPWEVARKNVIADLITKNSYKSDKTVLDIGCGDTWLVEQLSEMFPGCRFIAVDIAFDEALLKQYREKLDGKNVEVYNSLAEALSYEGAHIDIVLLLDVIEHIEDDVGFLKHIGGFENIDHKTSVFITVPAFQSLFCSHDHFLGHYRRYTNKQLATHVNKAGFQVRSIGYFFSSLLILRAMSTFIEKVKGAKGEDEAKGVAEWKGSSFDSGIASILFMDYKMNSLLSRAGIKFLGLSNFVVCQMSA